MTQLDWFVGTRKAIRLNRAHIKKIVLYDELKLISYELHNAMNHSNYVINLAGRVQREAHLSFRRDTNSFTFNVSFQLFCVPWIALIHAFFEKSTQKSQGLSGPENFVAKPPFECSPPRKIASAIRFNMLHLSFYKQVTEHWDKTYSVSNRVGFQRNSLYIKVVSDSPASDIQYIASLQSFL